MEVAKEFCLLKPRGIVKKPAGRSSNTIVIHKFFQLTFLNILSNITIPLAGIADTVVLGNFTESIYIAGVSLGTVLFDYLYWGFAFLRMGTTGTTAIKTGQGDEEGVFLVLFRSLLIGLAIGSGILVLSPWIGNLGFHLLAGDEELKTIGKAYFFHRIWDAPFTMMNLVFIGWFLGRSRSDIVLLLTLLSNGLNILLDYYFIVEWGMRADGVGMATALAQTFQFLLSTIIIVFLSGKTFPRNKKPSFQTTINPEKETTRLDSYLGDFRNRIFQKNEFLQILSFNKDIFLRTAFLIVTFSLFRNFSAAMGSDILTVNTILLQFMLVFAFFVDGSAFATETLAGDLYGRGETHLLQKIIRLGLGFGFLVSFGFILGLEVFPQIVLSWITNDDSIIHLAKSQLPGLYPVLVLGSVAFVYDGLFLGLVRGRVLRNSMFVATFLIFLPIAVCALYMNWNFILWMGLAGFMGGRALTLGWIWNKFDK